MIARPVPMTSLNIEGVLAESRRRTMNRLLAMLAGLLAIVWAFAYAGAFDGARYRDALRTILVLAGDSCPPDFGRWRTWGRPLAETLAMSIAGTVLAALSALPLGILAARNVAPIGLSLAAQCLLNIIRAIPDLVWGVLFVAAVGFGPLPGILALACHSTGMLGKFYAEILEHIDPAPGDALRSQGVPPLGILRFAIWPQILPRLVDVTLYRWEHNLRAATVLGVIGAGGIGLELITAFHLFEYREASALIIVMLALVTAINAIGGRIRARFLA
jgi:phosphonate transport system permease protein